MRTWTNRFETSALMVATAVLALACGACRSGPSAGGGSAAPSLGGGPQAETPAGDPTPNSRASEGATAVKLSSGSNGIGFDDLVFAGGMLRKVLAPAAATGNLDLIDPDTKAVVAIGGFSSSTGAYKGGHGEGTTSADEGRGLLFATDRTTGLLHVLDPAAKAIIASTKLGDGPDYVRWVDATGELWVTEPDAKVIEVFTLPPGPKPIPAHAINIRVDGGPESLVIDSRRKRAYTHLWSGSTAAIDIASHQIVATWSNGCRRSRGIALDTQRGFLFAACAEGTLVVLDIDHNGKQLGSVSSGSGVDVIAYSPSLAHVYFPGAGSATMAIVGVAASGQPTVLGTVPTASGAHCVTADDRGNAWVCDPDHGQLLVFRDAYPPSNGRK
jgi:DNA-binding beta-propeller fold protein YncE